MSIPSRAELADRYLTQRPFGPYPVQAEALLAWFTVEQGGCWSARRPAWARP